MKVVRELLPGDRIIVGSIKAKVGYIVFQDAYPGYSLRGESEATNGSYDIDFIDQYGNYRHWKSEMDGGRVEYYENAEILADLLPKIQYPLGILRNLGYTTLRVEGTGNGFEVRLRNSDGVRKKITSESILAAVKHRDKTEFSAVALSDAICNLIQTLLESVECELDYIEIDFSFHHKTQTIITRISKKTDIQGTGLSLLN